MGWALDILHGKLVKMTNDPKLILNEHFMMGLFKKLMRRLPPFREYWKLLWTKPKTPVVSRQSGAQLISMPEARTLIFNPVNVDDIACAPRVIELTPVLNTTLVGELTNEKKASWHNLSLSDSDICYKNIKDLFGGMLKSIKAANDDSKSALGETTANLQ